MNEIQGNDPKSHFLRRDLYFKSLKLTFEAYSIASSLSANENVPVLKSIAIADRLPLSTDEIDTIDKAEKLKTQLSSLQAELKVNSKSSASSVSSLQSELNSLVQQRDSLQKQLQAIEQKIATTQQQLTTAVEATENRKQELHRLEQSYSVRNVHKFHLGNLAKSFLRQSYHVDSKLSKLCRRSSSEFVTKSITRHSRNR